MIPLNKVKVGDLVHYQPKHYELDDHYENGVVKEIITYPLGAIKVVYKCNNDWLNYHNYQSKLTNLSDLNPGWRT